MTVKCSQCGHDLSGDKDQEYLCAVLVSTRYTFTTQQDLSVPSRLFGPFCCAPTASTARDTVLLETESAADDVVLLILDSMKELGWVAEHMKRDRRHRARDKGIKVSDASS